jgi:hypothetical protein
LLSRPFAAALSLSLCASNPWRAKTADM